MQHGGQSRFKVYPAGRNGRKRYLYSGWQTVDGAIGGRSRPRLDHAVAKRVERHRPGPGITSVLALNHTDLVNICDMRSADDAQGFAKTP
jgi:hypothetical protein